MGHFSLLFCLATYLLASTEAALDAEGIVGGYIAPNDKYKYQISIQNASGFHFCGGSIIGNQHVLTAAHCFTDEKGNPNRYFNQNGTSYTYFGNIVAGATEIFTDFNVIRVDIDTVYIPMGYIGYENTIVDDIAVVKLSQPLNLDDTRLDKVDLPMAEVDIGTMLTITGFGWTTMKYNPRYPDGEEGGYDTYKKKYALAEVVSHDYCSRVQNNQPIDARKICAKVYPTSQTNINGVCSGDSGGPLVYADRIIIGTLSTSYPGCNEAIIPAVYTKVFDYLNFINDAMNDRTGNLKAYPNFQ